MSGICLENFSEVYSCVPGLSHCYELWALLADQLLLSHSLPGHRLCNTSAESLCQGVSFLVLLAQWLSYLTLQSVPRINCLWQATSPSPLSSFKGEADLSLVVKHIPAVLHIEMLVRNAKSVFVWTSLQLCICEFKYLRRRAVSVPAVCMLRGCSEPGQCIPKGSRLCTKRCGEGGAGGCPTGPAGLGSLNWGHRWPLQ